MALVVMEAGVSDNDTPGGGTLSGCQGKGERGSLEDGLRVQTAEVMRLSLCSSQPCMTNAPQTDEG